ncbi:cell division ATP-binding protein FtsE [Candidatus Berkelbacteria bacterium CG_4_10_14_0_8_um_filter_35_9_33_8]|uniref:Cell division ATP-binding protein FtsE n=1 Tax=Candidatus Berkelbacteria bacterium CG_4_10_14_0_2_um_filter_35_9_33_12 TaxID=1974499 RepID=A0A2M7W3F7_9BACT|nr:MAG: cell division ATP-binding protein FtsE [Candidatus Berkelbacteria bacterium CG23_combo_of_CG06-09_8_20_14_all_33_15]PIS08661.1 MAG: cell division ATP-binding protein FtsE [Candidatus Berkelbacteria bacterium CG10_big_fil_rev_8_21_14_0_10_33_10]PIZ28024.1 MAG: cell division ATP-binding protein FtsE [Candidatus Berkelbacteria bacterium CG_4_10_14_0_8_um_filter_35_9_33_8]PJA20049.1 MAG: cell division ATP-binding protein FtsE [Candidatus Berkelbacteria bacterium CG_4_10_14_0_2_um_filter_35_9
MRAFNKNTKVDVVENKNRSLISIENVTKNYTSGIVALDCISFAIYEGEFVSLVGPSGAGKSTIIKLLIREEIPSHGQIFIANRNIATIKRYQMPYFRRKIGVVFQDYKLLDHKTVAENIVFALEVSEASDEEIKNRVPKILNLVGLMDRADVFPNSLSGGERQRVSIARALVHSPKILIADEPTGNLDPVTSQDVINLLRKINLSGTTVILATHNKEIVDQINQRVVKLEKGKLIEDRKTGGYGR